MSFSPTNAGNGLVTGLEATITSVSTTGSSLTLTIHAVSFGTRTVVAHASSATLFQGISGFSALAPGMFLNLDGALQSDGSLLATRLEVQNPSALNVSTGPNTITLIPQAINGTVDDSAASGNFNVYTVSLASYDLFPQLTVQPGQTTLLNNPSQVEVYVDSNTQKLNTEALAPGNTLRFYGLVFNDNGTLRMDCAQISD